MSLRTKFPTTEEKRELTKQLFKKHEEAFKILGVDKPLFIPKMNYYYQPLNCRVVGFFDSEMSDAKDIYVEFVDRYHRPEDAMRRLYKWTFDSDYKTNLEQDTSDKRFVKYIVPVKDFVLIEQSVTELDLPWKEDSSDPIIEKPIEKTVTTNVEKRLSDLPFSEMTIKDFIAILHRKPMSEKPWLNEIINQLNK